MKFILTLISMSALVSVHAFEVREISGKVSSFDRRRIVLTSRDGKELEIPRDLYPQELKANQEIAFSANSKQLKRIKEVQKKK